MGLKAKRLKKDIQNLSEGVLSRLTDLALVAIFFNLEIAFLKRREWWKVDAMVEEDLEEFNYEKLKRALSQLKQKGLIRSIREKSALPEITANGLKRLQTLIPQYDEKRVWDGQLYLITYDLPVEKNRKRDCLRHFLKTIGCGMLQQSLWITPYNPTKLIEKFVEENNLSEDLILVSVLGKGGTIGKMEPRLLIERVYSLLEINERYRQFIFACQDRAKSPNQLIFQYLSVLADDPQLPFALLPDWWEGERAHEIFLKLARERKDIKRENGGQKLTGGVKK
ncbi:MAG: PaaX family transcriptional regulator C-terminal domain-containing protein [Microgenomates group bacterium]